LHDQLVCNHEMMADILRQLSCACIVVGRDLTILHANKTARKYFTRAGRRSSDLEFSDLPHALGTKIYQVLKTGTGIATFKHHPEDSPEMVYHVTVVPFQRQNSVLPNSALMVVENHTHTEQLQRLELETSNLRLVKTMADRLAHEIGNALVPLSTHQQLLNTKYNDPEFRHSLDVALADTVKRVSRLINQMRFLAKDSVSSRENFPLAPLIEEAYQEAQQHQPVKSARLKFEHPCQTVIVSGDRSALKHALTEILINALQANTNDSHVGVRLLANSENNGNSCRVIQVEFQDNGAGFTSEAAKKVPEPFFTTRHVGLGLGLTVSKKILETHQGELSVIRSENGPCGIVRISIPLESIILQESSS
jgi:signal transduction histidine kinase